MGTTDMFNKPLAKQCKYSIFTCIGHGYNLLPIPIQLNSISFIIFYHIVSQ